MKNVGLLLIIISLLISCKSDKENDMNVDGKDSTVDSWEYQEDDADTSSSLTDQGNDEESENLEKDQNLKHDLDSKSDKSKVDPVQRIVTIDNGLIPFSTDGALKFLELEGLKIGMTVKEVEEYNIKANQNIQRRTIKTGKNTYEAYEITKGGVAVLHLIPTGDTITQMMFVGANSTPNNMAGVGTNFGSLKATYPNLGSTTSTTVLKIDTNVSLKMQADDKSTTGNSMSDAVTIINITVK
jgi:hypothetical protein